MSSFFNKKAILAIILTIISLGVLFWRVSVYRSLTTEFNSSLKDSGFWLLPQNENVSNVIEKDYYKGVISYVDVADTEKLTIGITQDTRGYGQFTVNRAIIENTINSISYQKDDQGRNRTFRTPQDAEYFYDLLNQYVTNQTKYNVEICVAKDPLSGSSSYSYICGINIYE